MRKLSRLVLVSLSWRAGSGVETRKLVRNVGFETRAVLGAREQDRGCAEMEVGKEEAVEKRKRPSSEEGNEAQEQQHEEGVGGSRASGEAAKKKHAKCPHNRQKIQCWQCEGSSTCEHR
jgi:hypothetical protein